MSGHPDAGMRCQLCNHPVNLRSDMNTDENGMAVHEDCYVRRICPQKALADRDMDSSLLAQVAAGDQEAIAALYDRYSTLVYGVALRACCDSASAEAVLQKVFLQIWRAPQEFDSAPGNLDGRLGLLSRSLAIDHMRKRKASEKIVKKREKEPVNLHSIGPAQVRGLLKEQHAIVLPQPNADRHVLEMAFFDGKTPSEIADETGFPVSTIASRLHRALSAVRIEASVTANIPKDTGLDVFDLDTHPEFTARRLHTRDLALQMEGLRRLTHSFVQSPDTILNELVNAAVELCGADSAGISIETETKSEEQYYRWVATAGQYNGFFNAVLPRYPSACGICLERGKPQLFRARQPFFDIMGITAPLVTDGILLPWQVEETRGTIFIMAHGRSAAFDKDDGQMMRVLADFAAMAVRHQRQQYALVQQARAAAAAAMADKLANHINKPLESLMNIAHLAAEGQSNHDARTLGQELSADLRRLSILVTESLASPGESSN